MQIAIYIFAILIVFFILVMVIDCHSLVVRNYSYTCADKDIQSVKKTLKIVMLSDMHGKHFGHDNSSLLRKIDSIEPDCIMIAGDMFTAGHRAKEDMLTARALVLNLASRYTIYYANGNHELKCKLRVDEFGSIYTDFVADIKKSGVIFLENENALLTDYGVRVYGLSLPFDYYKKSKHITPKVSGLNELLGTADAENFNIMLAHNPEYFEDYADWGANLVFSGHYHGGLMRLPIIGGVISPRYKLLPHYDYGEYHRGTSTMVLSCGLGTHTLPIRIFNPGEISVVTIK